ncbi:MAG: response regulator [Chloroflexi bacterium]|nr:response regulator [Chloroflexota bacterium]
MRQILAGEWVLVVDDGRENREFVVEYVLHPNGYRSLMAKDGVEGLEMALKHQPDLILLDFQMPRMNGAQVLAALQEHGLNIPVILMTFHGSEEVVMQVYRLGVRDYIKKPFSVDEMLLAIERSLTEVRLQREKEALTERVLQANRELQRRLQELNVLYSVGKSVSALLQMDQLLARIVEAAIQMTQAEEAYLYLLNGEVLHCRAQKRRSSAQVEMINQINNDNAIAIHVLKSGQPLLLTPEQLKTSKNPKGLVSASYAPLVLGNRVIGVLGVENLTPTTPMLGKHETALLSALTDYAAISIENSRHYENIRSAKENETAKIRDTFERFVAPSVVERALKQTDALTPGGERREISVLFADIRGYTTWSENSPPEDIVAMLNDYLSLAAEVIMGWEGTLDKFFGDGLMAIFNAPDEQPDHVHRATDAALALLKAADEVSKWRGYNLSYSVGVNVGEAVVGYIGTPRAMNYTAIGDVVNVTKRLQEVAAPGQILIEEAVVKRLGNLVQTRPLGALPLRGRKKQAFAYELIGLQYPDKG